MKLTKHIGCLLALAFATAPAFAADWFSSSYSATSGGAWSVVPAWTAAGTFVEINDWTAGVTFTAEAGKTVADEDNGVDSKISTTVKFTAIDGEGYTMMGEDFPQEMKDVLATPPKAGLTPPKAGLTVVESPVSTYTYWGLVEGVWTALTGTPDMANAVTVSVSFYKNDSGAATVEYRVGDSVLGTGAMPSADSAVSSIQYLGKCELYDDLKGLVWSNVPSKPNEIEIAGGKKIKFNHQELKGFAGVNPDDDASIKTFFETDGANGLKGWVNYAIGNVDESPVGVVSNKCEAGKVALDFGFAVAEGHTVEYVINSNGTDVASADITLDDQKNNTKIHTVDVKVDGEVIATETVGVMEATNPATTVKEEGKKAYDIVAVPWDAFAGQDLTVATLLNTAELTDGDMLYVDPNGNGVNYSTYLLADGKWTIPTGVTGQSSAEEQPVYQGSAIWLEHDTDSRIIFVGAVASKVTEKPTATAPAGQWTLVANPSIKKLDLNGTGVFNPAQVGDQIVIEDANDPRQYEYKGDGWGYYKSEVNGTFTIPGTTIVVPRRELVWSKEDCYVPAGIGFWYVNNNTDTTADPVTITFPDNQEETPVQEETPAAQ